MISLPDVLADHCAQAPDTGKPAWNDGFESGVKFAGGTVIEDREAL